MILKKNYGFSKASGDWILSVDADEEIPSQLASEVKKMINSKAADGVNGFWIPRKNYIFGKWIKENTGWYPDYQLRLFRKGKAKYEKKHVHENIALVGNSQKLKEHIIHHNYETVTQFLSKIMIYAPNEAEELLRKGYVFSYFDAIRFPLNDFLTWFFARKGYKDGFHGLVISLLMAFYHLVVFALIWEKKGFKEYEGDNFFVDTQAEFKKAGKDVAYWLTKEKLESIRNPISRNIARIKNKLN